MHLSFRDTVEDRNKKNWHAGSVMCASASDLGPGTALAYVELLETRRAYLSNLTPLPALPALLLSGERIDGDAAATRFLIDGWLLLRMHDGSGPKVPLKCMESKVQSKALTVLSKAHVSEVKSEVKKNHHQAILL